MLRRFTLAALCALSLSGCIDSAAPILTDAQPMLGQTLRLQVFSLRKGEAHDPEWTRYAWDGARYAHAGGGMSELKAFTVHPFEENNLIVQSVADAVNSNTEYALLHKLTDGVFLMVPIDEDDADAATSKRLCQRTEKSACRITTREQLLALARATAAQPKDKGALMIRVPNEPEPKRERLKQ